MRLRRPAVVGERAQLRIGVHEVTVAGVTAEAARVRVLEVAACGHRIGPTAVRRLDRLVNEDRRDHVARFAERIVFLALTRPARWTIPSPIDSNGSFAIPAPSGIPSSPKIRDGVARQGDIRERHGRHRLFVQAAGGLREDGDSLVVDAPAVIGPVAADRRVHDRDGRPRAVSCGQEEDRAGGVVDAAAARGSHDGAVEVGEAVARHACSARAWNRPSFQIPPPSSPSSSVDRRSCRRWCCRGRWRSL